MDWSSGLAEAGPDICDGGPMVKNLPSKAGDFGLIPYWGTNIPYAAKQQRLQEKTFMPQGKDPTDSKEDPTCCN